MSTRGLGADLYFVYIAIYGSSPVFFLYAFGIFTKAKGWTLQTNKFHAFFCSNKQIQTLDLLCLI